MAFVLSWCASILLHSDLRTHSVASLAYSIVAPLHQNGVQKPQHGTIQEAHLTEVLPIEIDGRVHWGQS